MEFDIAWVAINLLVGGVLGLISGTLGIGGGLLAVPLLALVYGMDQQTAQGTALVLMAPNMVIGFLRYRQRNPITFRMAAFLGGGAVIVAYLAALLVTFVSPGDLRILVSLFMILLSVLIAWRAFPHKPAPRERKALQQILLLPVGGIGGFCSGFFGIGGGMVVVPILTAFFAFSQTAAQGLALAMMAPSTLVALGAYANYGFVDWMLAIPLAVGSVLTVTHGVILAHRLPERKLKLAFSIMMSVLAVLMLLR